MTAAPIDLAENLRTSTRFIKLLQAERDGEISMCELMQQTRHLFSPGITCAMCDDAPPAEFYCEICEGPVCRQCSGEGKAFRMMCCKPCEDRIVSDLEDVFTKEFNGDSGWVTR